MEESCKSNEHHFVQAGFDTSIAGSPEVNKNIVLLYCTNCAQTKVLKIDELAK
jgi:hypothetical protein